MRRSSRAVSPSSPTSLSVPVMASWCWATATALSSESRPSRALLDTPSRSRTWKTTFQLQSWLGLAGRTWASTSACRIMYLELGREVK